MNLSVVIITFNEESNIGRTLDSVLPMVRDCGEIIVVDSGSTDRTVEIAREAGAKVYVETWKGFAAQKNSAIAKASCEYVLSLDADEVIEPELARAIEQACAVGGDAYWMTRRNFFLGREIRHGGFRERKLRLFRRGKGSFKNVPVHEVVEVSGKAEVIRQGAILHYAYPNLAGYLEHMNRYSSLGAELAVGKGHRSFSVVNVVIRPIATFIQKYFLKLGLLDGREGLLLCLYHSVYVSWKYAKAWELARKQESA